MANIYNEYKRAITKYENTARRLYDVVENTLDRLYTYPGEMTIDKFLRLSGMKIGGSYDYETVASTIASIGYEPESIFGKQYPFVYINMMMKMDMADQLNEIIPNCNFFNFYGNKPTIWLSDPYSDSYKIHKGDMLYYFEGNTTLAGSRGLLTMLSYAESEDGLSTDHSVNTVTNEGTMQIWTESFNDINAPVCDLIKKTNSLFKQGELQTLIARFHTNTDESKRVDPIHTAISKEYGMSHGRNLLKLENDLDVHSYDNPYCRVWTYHHQYDRLAKAIRPFQDVDEDYSKIVPQGTLDGKYGWTAFRTSNGLPLKSDENGTSGLTGGERLDKYGTLNSWNGLVNIAPTATIQNYFDGKNTIDGKTKVDLKRCMFSIENLAWKDFAGDLRSEYDPMRLSAEQQGPFGGRIMWFPPYGLTFNENVSVQWNEHGFIGRGEKIYTYSNTDRSGNLSFQLLIDHPAILDYWTGRKDTKPTNDGHELDLGNIGGVDNTNNQENTLLRFFAGCEILTAEPKKYWHRDANEEHPVTIQVEVEKDENNNTPEPENKAIVCMLYFPNNYSGKNDWGTIVDPIDYLMNGVYAQKEIVSGVTQDLATTKDFVYGYSIPNGQTIDVENSINQHVGGYEVREHPISFNHDHYKSGYTTPNTVSSFKRCMYAAAGEPQYKLDTEDAGTYSEGGYEVNWVTYGSGTTPHKLAKQMGSKAIHNPGTKSANKNWYYRKWYYRVDTDDDVENQVLYEKYNNYIDGKSLYLNSSGYTQTYDDKLFRGSGENQNSYGNLTLTKEHWISFLDLYLAINEGNRPVFTGLYNEDNISRVTKVLNEQEVTIKEIYFIGHASQHGSNSSKSVNELRNDTLANGRRETFKKFFTKHCSSLASKINDSTKIYVEEGTPVNPDVDEKVRKQWRSAEMVIVYSDNTNTENVNNGQNVTTKLSESKSITSLYSPNGTIPSLCGATSTQQAKREGLSVGDNITNAIVEKLSDGTYYGGETQEVPVDTNKTQEGIVTRYDNEGEFFQKLSLNDPFMHNLITEKIKYFDPAFHSISPEGFSSRLTFLHQCTRQGPTRGSTDQNGLVANNLAFGRPPVCVLRIGDFYYTKIIIKSLNITYDPLQWDLNQEGIGVMPMIAKVDINFQFIGGSDLAGPIARLQNALSFNYYANASVYDDRAEQVTYDDRGNVTQFKAYNPELEYMAIKKIKGEEE